MIVGMSLPHAARTSLIIVDVFRFRLARFLKSAPDCYVRFSVYLRGLYC